MQELCGLVSNVTVVSLAFPLVGPLAVASRPVRPRQLNLLDWGWIYEQSGG